MKHSLMHVSLHIIRFHELRVKYVTGNPSRTIMPFFPDYFNRDETEGIHSPRNSAVLLQ